MKSGQIIVFGTFLAYKHKFNFFSSFVPFYCKRPIYILYILKTIKCFKIFNNSSYIMYYHGIRQIM